MSYHPDLDERRIPTASNEGAPDRVLPQPLLKRLVWRSGRQTTDTETRLRWGDPNSAQLIRTRTAAELRERTEAVRASIDRDVQPVVWRASHCLISVESTHAEKKVQ